MCVRRYEGNPGEIGEGYAPRVTENWVWPHFERSAPALLGFDESIDRACSKVNPVDGHANNCITSNLNILSLYPPAQYNICRNYEWQVCSIHIGTATRCITRRSHAHHHTRRLQPRRTGDTILSTACNTAALCSTRAGALS